MGQLNDLTGQRFGRLEVLYRAQKPEGYKNRRAYYLCRCDCGNIVTCNGGSLLNGHTHSCGCYNHELLVKRNTVHGFCCRGSVSREYNIWTLIKSRCYNTRNEHYELYGGRGIKVCNRWRDNFPNFLEDMGESPEGMSIDRIDNDGDYEPGNCRWATQQQQVRNSSIVKEVTINGKTRLVVEWASLYNISNSLILSRMSRGWEGEDLLLPALIAGDSLKRYKQRVL